MTADDWQTVAVVFAGVVVAAMALLIVALGCIDDLTEQLKRERSDARLRDIARLPNPSRGPENIA